MLKACLVFLGINFKRNHNLVYLLDLLTSAETIPDLMYDNVECLEAYAVEIRYPDTLFIPTVEQTESALNTAILVKGFFRSRVSF